MNADISATQRWSITISILLASVMSALDQTIANVALPHIQGSIQASQEQTAWILTSYLIASAIVIPMTGWLVNRLGRKRMFLISIVGFTVSSMLCGLATSLPEIVAFRLMQGALGAPLMPLSQTVLLDINPPAKHGQAMALWGAGTLLGPILGPALGGWLTDNLTWRWVFFINLPIGILAAAGMWLFMAREPAQTPKRLDFLGFGSIVAFIGGAQLVLDRGPSVDWFHSQEVWIEAIIAAMGLWVFVTHTLTAERPFFDRSLAKDRNFVTAAVCTLFFSSLVVATTALLPSMMQNLLGYSVLRAGFMSMPRGFGTMIAMLTFSKLPPSVNPRIVIGLGVIFSVIALLQMLDFDLSMSMKPFIVSGVLQGLGMGLTFVVLSTTAFSTLSPGLRAEGSALFALVRGLGSSAGVSITQALLVSNSATMHASLVAHLDPSDPVVRADVGQRFDMSTVQGLAGLDAEVSRQAAMIAYIDDFKLLLMITLACVPLMMFVRRASAAPGEAVHVAVE